MSYRILSKINNWQEKEIASRKMFFLSSSDEVVCFDHKERTRRHLTEKTEYLSLSELFTVWLKGSRRYEDCIKREKQYYEDKKRKCYPLFSFTPGKPLLLRREDMILAKVLKDGISNLYDIFEEVYNHPEKYRQKILTSKSGELNFDTPDRFVIAIARPDIRMEENGEVYSINIMLTVPSRVSIPDDNKVMLKYKMFKNDMIDMVYNAMQEYEDSYQFLQKKYGAFKISDMKIKDILFQKRQRIFEYILTMPWQEGIEKEKIKN